MDHDADQSGWREYLSLYANLFGIVGGVVSLAGLLSLAFGILSGGLLVAVISIGATLFCVWLMGHVFVRNRDPLQGIGALKDGQESIPSATAPTGKLPLAEKPQLVTGAQTKLTFEIDEEESQVRVGSGPDEVRAIYADIKLRCFKVSEAPPMAIKGFHASLHRKWRLGDEATVLDREDGVLIWQFPHKEIQIKDVWTITEPSTEYRIYHFILNLTPKIQADLSDEHFLRVTMDAVGLEPISQTVYVHDWHVMDGNFSPVSLKPLEELPLAATKEINRLKGEVRSYEKTNANLGEFIENYRREIDLAKRQKGEIDKWVKVEWCEQGDMNLRAPIGSPCTVRLAIHVRNKSILSISLSDELVGNIKFHDTPLLDQKRVINSVKNAACGERHCLTIEQRLSPSDVQMLLLAQHSARPQFFNFDELKVQIVGGKDSPDITAEFLVMGPSATAFPLDLQELGQRIRVLGEVHGSGLQLYESLRIADDPLPKETIERWKTLTLSRLEKAYQDEGALNVWKVITHGDPFPNTAPSQRSWLETCFVQLGALLAELTGEFNSRNTRNNT